MMASHDVRITSCSQSGAILDPPSYISCLLQTLREAPKLTKRDHDKTTHKLSNNVNVSSFERENLNILKHFLSYLAYHGNGKFHDQREVTPKCSQQKFRKNSLSLMAFDALSNKVINVQIPCEHIPPRGVLNGVDCLLICTGQASLFGGSHN